MGIAVGIGVGVGVAVGVGSGSGSGVGAGVGSGANVGVGSAVGVGSGVDVGVGVTVWSGTGADMVGSAAGSTVESRCCPAAPVGSGVRSVVPSVTADGRRWLEVTVGTGMVLGGDALDKGLDVVCVGDGCVPDCAATNSAVPVGALTKILVRPGSAPVHPAASAISDRMATANAHPRLAVK